MPRKRYFCDFCDKSFADNQTNRRNHLNGVQHKLAKKEHYGSFKDPQILLEEDANKKPCRKFFQEKDCKFGKSCKFSHMGNEERERYIVEVNSRNIQNSSREYFLQNVDAEEIVKSWLTEEKLEELQASTPDEKEKVQFKAPLKLPVEFTCYKDLPPSLMPYDIQNIKFCPEWG